MTGAERDRDIDGRARQARPRDALGRPLAYGAEGVEPVSEEALPPSEALKKARELIAAGRPFAAHEVLEARWKAGPIEDGDLWQGLARSAWLSPMLPAGTWSGRSGFSSGPETSWPRLRRRGARATAST